jgi:hypothetical protein
MYHLLLVIAQTLTFIGLFIFAAGMLNFWNKGPWNRR